MLPFVDILGYRIYLYGLLIVSGVMLGLGWLVRQRGRAEAVPLRLDENWFWIVVCAHVGGGVLGGKFGFFLVGWREFGAPPWDIILHEWGSGWVHWFELLGGVSCGWLGLQLYNRRHRQQRRYAPFADYVIIALAVGLWVGRLACWCAGCCHGRPTDMPWGVRFTSPAASVADNLIGMPLHPTQLYEAAGVFALGLFLMLYVLPRIERRRFMYGTAYYSYCVLYSLLRFAAEFFRGDDRGRLLGLPAIFSPAQWIALVCGAFGISMLWRQGIRVRRPEQRDIFF